MNVVRLLVCFMSLLLLSACATPKRGDLEFAPVKPVKVVVPWNNSGSIYNAQTSWLLNEDLRARRVGDMLTVMLEEKTDAEKSASTATSKSTSAAMQDPVLFGRSLTRNGHDIGNSNLGSDHSFDGSGDSNQSNSLSGSVTVVVVEILANGNLMVQGEKWININQGEEFVRFKGIVRTSDIKPDNTISSVRVANAQIQYSGDSVIADSNNTGWLAKFFNSPFMPF